MPGVRVILGVLLVTGASSASCQGGSSAHPAGTGAGHREAILSAVGAATARVRSPLRAVTVDGVEYQSVEHTEGFTHVLVGRRTSDGQVETRCVENEAGAARFFTAKERQVQ